MKYYDEVISLGQHCRAATALKVCKLRSSSNVFDWSAGILEDKAGKGGLQGKVGLICNDFKNLFDFEDLENRGLTNPFDENNLWVVNKRTGLQYTHDFPKDKTFEEGFIETKKKLERRICRFNLLMSTAKRILFLYIAWDLGFEKEYLIEQQQKLANKFPDKQIDFLYLLHDGSYSETEYRQEIITPNVTIYYLNVHYPYDMEPSLVNSDGNTKLYYPLLKQYCFTPETVKSLNSQVDRLNNEVRDLRSMLLELKSRPTSLQQIFSVRNEGNHKVLRIFGVKMKFKHYKY